MPVEHAVQPSSAASSLCSMAPEPRRPPGLEPSRKVVVLMPLMLVPKTLQSKLWLWRRLATGRHEVRAWVIPTVAGLWAWRATCVTCGAERGGVERSSESAFASARALVGGRDEYLPYTATKLTSRVPVDLATDGQVLLRYWAGAMMLTLPQGVRGDGFTVAVDGSYAIESGKAAWGVVTDAGWCWSGQFDSAPQAGAQSAELSAVQQGLRVYPNGSDVTVLIDNVKAGEVVQQLVDSAARGQRIRSMRLPAWVDREQANYCMLHIRRLASVRVLWVRKNTHHLHKSADRLARRANGKPPKKGQRRGVIEPVVIAWPDRDDARSGHVPT